ncbi:protein kinase domain-containing protein [Streptomyces spectabilis]|uniref:Serine/threonine protein kinase n=1 Tax=Streptomyces spectabilis TaxID=68270 RepID=A0A516R7C0_STRST|nr:serine/threonine-protein kinase [Streptomyces spectabilis]QDQ11559.1 serine/threonine protein kinase [Streptomyces spectabilis]
MALRETDPKEVGGYPVEDRLGSGGMGVVYLARSASGRRLAVKVVHAQYADDPEFRTRFRREVEAARQVSGAFTAPVVDADADAPSPWMATLYIPGENLGDHVRRHGPLPAERLLELAAGLTEALRDIHRVGVVHRDLKPANVMLAEDGPRVIDFGVSRAAEALAGDALTQTGRVMGTPPYMSPEQLTSPRDVGPASDVFSLGSVLVHAATGRGPFDDVSPYETATRVVEGDAGLDDVPDDLRALVTLCLAKHPKERPTPDELLAVLRGDPVPPRPAVPAEGASAPRPRRRRRLLITGAVGGVLAAVLTLGAVQWLQPDDPGARSLPPGWRAWQAQDTRAEEGSSTPFSRCVAARGGLVCAGGGTKAARFSLATGKLAWSASAVGGGGLVDQGTVFGASADRERVYVYRDKSVARSDDSAPEPVYEFQALDSRTGKELWRRAPLWGQEVASGPNSERELGDVAVVQDGLLARYGAKADRYALLADRTGGEPRWQRPLPDPDSCGVDAADGHGYLLCLSEKETRLSRLDPDTGEPSWTTRLPGALLFLGQADGRLVFGQNIQDGAHRTLVTVDVASGGHTVRSVPLSHRQPGAASVTLSDGTVYYTLWNGRVSAVDPRSGRQLWSTDSEVENPGPPLAGETHVFLASPSGRLGALYRHTGAVDWSRPARSADVLSSADTPGAPLTLVGDALYVPYGIRSVYSVDVRHP